jgi:hypothetical protein
VARRLRDDRLHGFKHPGGRGFQAGAVHDAHVDEVAFGEQFEQVALRVVGGDQRGVGKLCRQRRADVVEAVGTEHLAGFRFGFGTGEFDLEAERIAVQEQPLAVVGPGPAAAVQPAEPLAQVKARRASHGRVISVHGGGLSRAGEGDFRHGC